MISLYVLSGLFFTAHADNDFIITYVISDDREIYNEFIHKINHKKYSVLNVEHFSSKTLETLNTDLFITIGAKATRKVMESSKNKNLLALFITKTNYLDISKKFNRKFSAIFIDQPVSRQLRLIKSAFKEKTHIGVAVSNQSRMHIPELVESGNHLGLRIHIETLPDPDSIHHIIRKLADNNDLILAMQDSNLYNKYTIQNILMTTYHANIPLIGYSRPYVQAGALMSVYTSIDNLALQTNELIKQVIKGMNLPSPDYCKYYSIELNHQVANSLAINLDDKSVLLKRLINLEDRYQHE
ncbi:MAG: hypothetical protein OEW89_01060 [Gammaproteobacteria bacterium]|nr:hypothetical protein [Gammaproteobacteria bacterium]MDH5594639.1 hypothetical protein [Gammaproteobacteria bacterium]